MKKRILLVDDHPLIRKGIGLTLEESLSYEVCCQLSSAEETINKIGELNPDGAVIDISLTGMNGIELVKHIRTIDKEMKILMVSRHDEDLYAERALRAGANGYLMKQVAAEELNSALDKIFNGGIYLSDEMSSRMLQQAMGKGPKGEQSPLEVLSDRELEVFELTGVGQSNKEIADRMHVSAKTVETYKARIREKLGHENSHELARAAMKWVED